MISPVIPILLLRNAFQNRATARRRRCQAIRRGLRSARRCAGVGNARSAGGGDISVGTRFAIYATRTRGSRYTYSRSAMKFAMITAKLKNRNMPCSSAKSFDCSASNVSSPSPG